MRIVSFGSYTFGENKETGWGTQGRSALVPLQIGAYDQLGSDFYATEKELTVALDVYGSLSDVSDQLDTLRYVQAQGRQKLIAETRPGQLRQCDAKIKNVGDPRDDKTPNLQKVDITFELASPFLYASDDVGWTFDSGETFDSGLKFDSGNRTVETLSIASTDFDIEYTGTVELYKSSIKISPQAAASTTAVTITNTTTGAAISWNAALVAGDVLVFEMSTQSVTLDGVAAYADFSKAITQSGWLTLIPGTNEITVDVTGIVGDIDFTWRWERAYLR